MAAYSLHLAFLLASYLLIFLGLIGLSLTEEISSPYLIAAWASFAVGAFIDYRGGKSFLPWIVANLLLLAVLALTAFSIFVLQAPPLQELVHFLLGLQAVKLVAPKGNRDWLQLYLLSFFDLVAAAALSVELYFAGIFLSYVLAAPFALVVFQLKRSLAAAGKEADDRLLGQPLARLVVEIDIVLVLLTLAFFLAFPRFGGGYFGYSRGGGTVTGFSDRLALGEVAEIQKSNTVAMRVEVDRPDILRGRELYWRGLALDHFDGRRWQRSLSGLIPLRRVGESYTVDGSERRGPLVRQKVFLEPVGSPALFSLNRPLVISGSFPNLFRDPLGNVRTAYPFPFPSSYEAVSYLETTFPEERLSGDFLQLPPLDPRIAELAQRRAAGLSDDLQKARALERYLKATYHYTLEGLPSGERDPLAVFLFELRRGNCEYFASSLAVMLRQLGIPARVVNGYRGGEWNPYGEYFLIRQVNAHSWVEAYVSGRGWITLDPTPPNLDLTRPRLLSPVTDLFDYLRMRWYRYVINFSHLDQYQFFTALRRPDHWFRPRLPRISWPELRRSISRNGLAAAALIVIGLAVAWRLRRKMRRARPGEAGFDTLATERYRRFLRLVKVRKKGAETADEFLERLGTGRLPLLEEFTRLYQECRFSGRKDSRPLLRRMDEILSVLPSLLLGCAWPGCAPRGPDGSNGRPSTRDAA